MQELKAENVVEFAHRVGIQSKLDAVPSLCLGTSDVSLFEMVGAYSTFVNGGIEVLNLFSLPVLKIRTVMLSKSSTQKQEKPL
ncbi:MAG: hypothetical protein U5K54_28920 [Cytophagales bacterium]|nr:hypothetical protein [Cytophagales bacterium]